MLFFVEEHVKIFIGEQKKIKKVKMIKYCSKCKFDKDVTEFYLKKGRTGLSGYSSSCKDCVKISKHKYYENNKDILCNKSKE